MILRQFLVPETACASYLCPASQAAIVAANRAGSVATPA